MSVARRKVIINNEAGRCVGTETELGTYDVFLQRNEARKRPRKESKWSPFPFRTATAILKGEGAYDGLTAYLILDRGDRIYQALIFPGEPSPIVETDVEPPVLQPDSPQVQARTPSRSVKRPRCRVPCDGIDGLARQGPRG